MSEFRLPRLRDERPIVSPATGKPNSIFMQWWQSVVEKIEAVIRDITAMIERISTVEVDLETLQNRNLTAGSGLTGGGNLTDDRTFDVGAGEGVSVTDNAVALDLDSTRNVDHAAVEIEAGEGLTGGGDLTETRALSIGAGTGIQVNADDVALDTTDSHNVDHSDVSLIAGSGLTGGGTIEADRTLNVGAGAGIIINADDVAVDPFVVATLADPQTFTGVKTFADSVAHSGAPGATVTADVSGAAISKANGGTVDFPNFSGSLLITDYTTGATGFYICGAGGVSALGPTGTVGGALTYNAGINGYTFTNTSGGTRSFAFASTKTRNTG